jgi:hypothetical protein
VPAFVGKAFPEKIEQILDPALLPTEHSSDEAELLQADAVPTNGYERGRSSGAALDQRCLYPCSQSSVKKELTSHSGAGHAVAGSTLFH